MLMVKVCPADFVVVKLTGKIRQLNLNQSVIITLIMAMLSRDDVLKLAQLARLELSDAEVEEYATELSAVLQYVEQLSEVNVKGLKPTQQVTGLTNVTREDEVKNYGYDPKDLLKNVPETKDGHIKAKRMVG